jgi:hypothetical protein
LNYAEGFQRETTMFRFFVAKKTEDVLRKAKPQSQSSYQSDSCKRAVVFFPETSERSQDVQDTVKLRFHHLLVGLEGQERTGCLKISSPRSRSRSAMLLFRGRVVGAVYGSKNMRGQYLHKDAHNYALHDLASPGNLLDAYELPEDLVLAAAALFYGETLETNYGQSLETIFDDLLATLQRSGQPGCLVINSWQEETICIVYVANGRIVGIFSATDGWKHGSAASARRFLANVRCKIHAAVLPLYDQGRLGFSLTGLGDLPGTRIDARQNQDFPPTRASGAQPPEAPARVQSVQLYPHMQASPQVVGSRSYAGF